MADKILLEVVNHSQDRVMVPVFKDDPERPVDMATGHIRNTIVVRTSTGRHWLLDVPNEMFEDLKPGLDVRDDVVPA